jgi:hypothetical protein
MARITFDPTTDDLEVKLRGCMRNIERALNVALPNFGVKVDDIILDFKQCTTEFCSFRHINVTVVTDSTHLTADDLKVILEPHIGTWEFEVTRIFVGGGGDWASNYD